MILGNWFFLLGSKILFLVKKLKYFFLEVIIFIVENIGNLMVFECEVNDILVLINILIIIFELK